MRLFGSERIASMMDRMGLKDGEEIQAGMMTKAIERAQKKVEENNFGIRKRLLEYDDVMNSQRTVIYSRRRNALAGERIDIDRNNIVLDFAETFRGELRRGGFRGFQFRTDTSGSRTAVVRRTDLRQCQEGGARGTDCGRYQRRLRAPGAVCGRYRDARSQAGV